jgi:hypothetical protein
VCYLDALSGHRMGSVPIWEVAVMVLVMSIEIALVVMIVAVVGRRSVGPRRARVRSTYPTRQQLRQERARRMAERRAVRDRF